MKTEYKHIQFDLIDNCWYCYTKDGQTDLGRVYFDFANWKCFVWSQNEDVKFDIACLKDVISFMSQL